MSNNGRDKNTENENAISRWGFSGGPTRAARGSTTRRGDKEAETLRDNARVVAQGEMQQKAAGLRADGIDVPDLKGLIPAGVRDSSRNAKFGDVGKMWDDNGNLANGLRERFGAPKLRGAGADGMGGGRAPLWKDRAAAIKSGLTPTSLDNLTTSYKPAIPEDAPLGLVLDTSESNAGSLPEKAPWLDWQSKRDQANKGAAFGFGDSRLHSAAMTAAPTFDNGDMFGPHSEALLKGDQQSIDEDAFRYSRMHSLVDAQVGGASTPGGMGPQYPAGASVSVAQILSDSTDIAAANSQRTVAAREQKRASLFAANLRPLQSSTRANWDNGIGRM